MTIDPELDGDVYAGEVRSIEQYVGVQDGNQFCKYYFFRGLLGIGSLRASFRELSEGTYEIICGDERVQVQQANIRRTVLEMKWLECEGTIRGPIKPKEAEE